MKKKKTRMKKSGKKLTEKVIIEHADGTPSIEMEIEVTEEELAERAALAKAFEPRRPAPPHDCFDHASFYETSDGRRRYHGWTCALCGALIQAG